MIPDGNFPTVKSPNPEEKEALQLGIDKLKESNADLLIATDPDADRVGIAIRHRDEIHMLNGNQIACLCLYYILSKRDWPEKAAFVKTIGTTELFKVICEAFGKRCDNVLTGFKYIAEKIREWEKDPNGPQFIFAGEESYGYLLGTQTRDKDAIIALILIAEAALYAKLRSKTLLDLLHEIYEKYGFYFEKLSSLEFPESKEGKQQIEAGMERLRRDPPKKFGKTLITSIEDYLASTKTHLKTGEKTPLHLAASDVLLFWLEDGSKVMIRPSGTEPKIKIYCGIKQDTFASITEAEIACDAYADNLIASLKHIFDKR